MEGLPIGAYRVAISTREQEVLSSTVTVPDAGTASVEVALR